MGSWVSWSDSYGWVVILVEFIGLAQPDVILARIRLAVEHPAVSLYLPLSQRSLSFFLQLRHTRYQQTCFDCLSVLEKLSALLYTLHLNLGFLLSFVSLFLACIGAKQQLNQ